MKKILRKTNKGFTLVEIMVAIGIIITLAALSITGLVRSRITASETAAIESLKTLQAAFEYYRLVNTDYPRIFEDLCTATPPYLDASWNGFDTSPVIKDTLMKYCLLQKAVITIQ